MNESKNHTNLKLIATSMASASILTSCGPKEPPEVQDWRKAPGTNGFINLKDVVEAFHKLRKVEAFEKRVNEIFEGDNMVIFTSKPSEANNSKIEGTANGFIYAAFEDLDKDGKVNTRIIKEGQLSGDDPLFTIAVKNEKATLYGHGVNKYYKYSWTYKPLEKKQEETAYRNHYHSPYYHHWYHGSGWGGYYSPREKYHTNTKEREKFRRSSGYTSQLNTNADFEKSAARKYGSSFTSSVGQQSQVRKDYINKVAKSDNIHSTIRSNPASKIKSSSRTSSTYSKAAAATNSIVGGSRGGSFGSSRGSSGIGI